jgi:hypothetical protein
MTIEMVLGGRIDKADYIWLILGNPLHIRVKQQEQDHRERQYVHVDAEHYTGVVHAPSRPETAESVVGAVHGGESGQDEIERAAVMREVREDEREEQAAEDQKVAA